MLTVLSVAYTLAPVGPDAVGGAEQVLSTLDGALVRAGHRSIVVACAGSQATGELVVTAELPRGMIGEAERQHAYRATRDAMAAILRRERVDIVHMHGIDFLDLLPSPGPPTLVTLHLPPDWYPPAALAPTRPNTWLHCVSEAQHAECPPSASLLPPIGNGVPVEALGQARHARRSFALTLGRICPEKGTHLALEAAREAGVALLIGGEVFSYPEHRAYFDAEVVPRLDGARRFLGPVGFARKRRLLAAARCLLVPSLAPETSSLVAMEALACGTPVIAFRSGALTDIVEHHRNGYLVSDVTEMATAIHNIGEIDPAVCRAAASDRFSQTRMVAAYMERYHAIAARQAT